MDITENIALSRKSMIKRWLLEPELNRPPNDLTFSEIHGVLDSIEARVEECRKLYPWSAPKDTHDAIIRSMPPHLRAGSKQDTAPVDISA